MTLRQHLESLNGDILRGLLKKLGISQTGLTRKEQFADALERQLSDGIEAVLATLGGEERTWLADSAHQERFVGEAEFVARFGGPWPWRSSDNSWSYRRDPSALDAMVHRDWQEGRRVFGNIVKYIKMAASSNFGNMFSVVGASAFLPFLPMLPIQVLTNNLL